MESTLKRLGKIETCDIGTSNFVKPLGIKYELDGKLRKWVSCCCRMSEMDCLFCLCVCV